MRTLIIGTDMRAYYAAHGVQQRDPDGTLVMVGQKSFPPEVRRIGFDFGPKPDSKLLESVRETTVQIPGSPSQVTKVWDSWTGYRILHEHFEPNVIDLSINDVIGQDERMLEVLKRGFDLVIFAANRRWLCSDPNNHRYEREALRCETVGLPMNVESVRLRAYEPDAGGTWLARYQLFGLQVTVWPANKTPPPVGTKEYFTRIVSCDCNCYPSGMKYIHTESDFNAGVSFYTAEAFAWKVE